ncbi:hypothetical protein DA717_08795 [Piscirickettsiaceae bacterium NZ-RLO2]|nr:hypothetical protein DA717_08795 [Piscirickettsiaceae bacterium NZ-RLO2]
MPKLSWESEEHKKKEWEIAEKHLRNGKVGEETVLPKSKPWWNPKLYTDQEGIKHKINHDFIVVDGQIFALAGTGNYLGKGSCGTVKLAEDKKGNIYAVKTGSLKYIPESELQALTDVNSPTGRKLIKGHMTKGHKRYVLLHFFGISLDKVNFKGYRHKLDACFQAVHLVKLLNRGALSESGTEYYHSDIKPENFVMDKEGNVELIDFGSISSRTNPSTIDTPMTIRYQAPEIERRFHPHSPTNKNTETYSLGKTLKDILPKGSRLRHTASLMSSPYPSCRPNKIFIEIDILVERYQDSDQELTEALDQYHIPFSCSEAKAISALLQASTPEHNLTIRENIQLIKNCPNIKSALIMAHNYLQTPMDASKFGITKDHGYRGRKETKN